MRGSGPPEPAYKACRAYSQGCCIPVCHSYPPGHLQQSSCCMRPTEQAGERSMNGATSVSMARVGPCVVVSATVT